ncbi:MAG: hypothetical protein QOH36_929 [Actinomycetota bacterium]|nr:hypothetical protein [Actinomycetota bacterium]
MEAQPKGTIRDFGPAESVDGLAEFLGHGRVDKMADMASREVSGPVGGGDNSG